VAASPPARGVAVALGGLAKFATLALAPLFATHGRPGVRGLLAYSLIFGGTVALAMGPRLEVGVVAGRGEGKNGDSATGVTFGGVPVVTFTVDSDTQIRALLPASAATGKITVTGHTGIVTSLANFEVTTPPAVTSFQPTWGKAGTEVTLTGSGFTGATQVKFGDFEASSFTIDSDTQLRAIVPTDAVSAKVTVVTGNGTALGASNFMVSPSTAPAHWVYLPVQLIGGGASANSPRTTPAALYSTFSSDVRAAGNLRTFICGLDL